MRGLVIFLLAFTFCGTSPVPKERVRTVSENPSRVVSEGNTVTIVLTKFDVNDERLELRYKINNPSPRDIWTCDGIGLHLMPDPKGPEIFLDSDGQTLVIRKRMDVPDEGWSNEPVPYEGRFVRIGHGAERMESLSIGIPVRQQAPLAARGIHPGFATRIVLEIGFYDGDLPRTMRTILDIADKLTPCADNVRADMNVYTRYFGGIHIAGAFGGLTGFQDWWQEGSDEIRLPYLDGVPIVDEQCLRIVVEGVNVAYQGIY